MSGAIVTRTTVTLSYEQDGQSLIFGEVVILNSLLLIISADSSLIVKLFCNHITLTTF